jgi:ketosteroid isomerase-like protein
MSLDRAGFQDWLNRYVAAWKSYDPAAIGDLFSEDVEYRYHPQDEPVIGRDAVVADWLGNKDEPGTYDAQYEPVAIDRDAYVAKGWSRYLNADGTPRDEYFNIYLLRFDGDGRATSFTEYWIQNREFARAARQKVAADAVAAARGSATDAGT